MTTIAYRVIQKSYSYSLKIDVPLNLLIVYVNNITSFNHKLYIFHTHCSALRKTFLFEIFEIKRLTSSSNIKLDRTF